MKVLSKLAPSESSFAVACKETVVVSFATIYALPNLADLELDIPVEVRFLVQKLMYLAFPPRNSFFRAIFGNLQIIYEPLVDNQVGLVTRS